jgi:hypothetical protein
MPRILCKLCAFEAVQGTVLCNGHLEGFKYAVGMLTDKQAMPLIRKVMQQPAEQSCEHGVVSGPCALCLSREGD